MVCLKIFHLKKLGVTSGFYLLKFYFVFDFGHFSPVCTSLTPPVTPSGHPLRSSPPVIPSSHLLPSPPPVNPFCNPLRQLPLATPSDNPLRNPIWQPPLLLLWSPPPAITSDSPLLLTSSNLKSESSTIFFLSGLSSIKVSFHIQYN